jgi:LAO/AO transport system kinase
VSSADPSDLVDAARAGDRRALARVLSAVERGGAAARAVAERVHPLGGRAHTVGVTGSPGAGKSTLTSGFVAALRSTGAEVAVLAIDPSSPFTGGAILGDRVRMGDHALDPGVFIRSMATRGHLGGLALATPEAIRVLFVINKADRDGVRDTRRDLEQMLDLSTPTSWRPPVVETVATTADGIAGLVEAVADHRTHLEAEGRLAQRRAERAAIELRRIVAARIDQRAGGLCSGPAFDRVQAEVVTRALDPWAAADRLLDGP